jgi:conjugative transfer region protein TrbK
MKTTGLDWVASFNVLISAIVLAAIALITPTDSSSPQGNAERRVAAITALDIELARCKTLGPYADSDAACLKAWRVVNKRFTEYELHHGVAATRTNERAGWQEDASPRDEASEYLQSTPTHDPVSARVSASLEEQPW